MKILAHARAYSELLAALPTLGITLAENQSIPDAIRARLEGAAAQPSAAAVESAAVALLTGAGLSVAQGQTAADALKAYAGEIEQAAANLNTAQASLASINGALAKAGVKIAADAKPADIEAAIQARVSIRAGEHVAALGTPPVEAAPAAASSSVAQPASTAGREIEAVAAIYAERRAKSAARV